METYVPSSDEITKAEEVMSAEQKAMSEQREKEDDLNFVRKEWNDAGDQLSAKLTRETGILHTAADALQPIAEANNAFFDSVKNDDTEKAKRIRDVIAGHFNE